MKQLILTIGVLAILAVGALFFAPTPSGTSPLVQELVQTPPPPDMSEDERKRMVEEASAYFEKIEPGGTTIVSGLETLGSRVTIADKEIQLPQDVYVRAIVSHISCVAIEGYSCPEIPYMSLAYADADGDMNNDDGIGVVIRTGEFIETGSNDWPRKRERFSWLEDRLQGDK